MDFSKKNKSDLIKMLKEKKESLRVFRFNVAGSKARNVKEGKTLKKEIAVISTEISARNKKELEKNNG